MTRLQVGEGRALASSVASSPSSVARLDGVGQKDVEGGAQLGVATPRGPCAPGAGRAPCCPRMDSGTSTAESVALAAVSSTRALAGSALFSTSGVEAGATAGAAADARLGSFCACLSANVSPCDRPPGGGVRPTLHYDTRPRPPRRRSLHGETHCSRAEATVCRRKPTSGLQSGDQVVKSGGSLHGADSPAEKHPVRHARHPAGAPDKAPRYGVETKRGMAGRLGGLGRPGRRAAGDAGFSPGGAQGEAARVSLPRGQQLVEPSSGRRLWRWPGGPRRAVPGAPDHPRLRAQHGGPGCLGQACFRF